MTIRVRRLYVLARQHTLTGLAKKWTAWPWHSEAPSVIQRPPRLDQARTPSHRNGWHQHHRQPPPVTHGDAAVRGVPPGWGWFFKSSHQGSILAWLNARTAHIESDLTRSRAYLSAAHYPRRNSITGAAVDSIFPSTCTPSFCLSLLPSIRPHCCSVCYFHPFFLPAFATPSTVFPTFSAVSRFPPGELLSVDGREFRRVGSSLGDIHACVYACVCVHGCLVGRDSRWIGNYWRDFVSWGDEGGELFELRVRGVFPNVLFGVDKWSAGVCGMEIFWKWVKGAVCSCCEWTWTAVLEVRQFKYFSRDSLWLSVKRVVYADHSIDFLLLFPSNLRFNDSVGIIGE